jgi:hypothetical protein
MRKLAIVALPALFVITAAMGFLFSRTPSNASHSVRNANRGATSHPAAAHTGSAAASSPIAPAPSAAQATTQPESSGTYLLPASLTESVAANFAGYHVPSPADIKEAWGAKDAGVTPFLAQGDFNGDGRIDAALIILGESDWKLVIFEQDDQQRFAPAAVFRPKTIEEVPGHSANSVIAAPQHLVLSTIEQGETWAPEAGDVPTEVKLKSDGIRLSWRPKPNYDYQSLIYFDDGKYQTRWAETLLQVR